MTDAPASRAPFKKYMQEAPILLLTALSDTATRAVRRRNSAQGDAERGVRGSVRWTAQAYAHQHTAFASQLISRRDRCRSLPPPIYLSPLLGAFDAMTAQEVQRNFADLVHRRHPGL